ncbi:MAG: hypothetical protein WAQ52_04930 [Terriglobales bacterium]
MCSVQQGVESPRTGDLIGLEFRNEEFEFGGTVMSGFASTRANIEIKALVVAGIADTDRKGL